MLRDLLVARTGSWSASAILDHAYLLGYRGRRASALAAIRDSIGRGTRLAGRQSSCTQSVPESVPESVPGTDYDTKRNRFPRKRKEAKEKEIYITPQSASHSLPPQDFGDLEPDVETYCTVAAEANLTGKITAGRRSGLRSALYAVLVEIGDRRAFAAGLRAANAKGAANPIYVRKAAENARLIGSRAHANGVVGNGTAIGSRGAQQPFFLRPENGATDYAAALASRVIRSDDATDDERG